MPDSLTAAAGAVQGGPAWLAGLRAAALDQLRRKGFPDRRDEDWKYTRVRPILDAGLVPATPSGAAVADLPDGPRLVFVDGRYRPDLSAPPPGAQALSEAADAPVGQVLGSDLRGFDALNTAMVSDGAWIRVDPGADGGTVELVHVHTRGGQFTTPRHVIEVGRSGQLRLVERYLGVGSSLTAAVVEIRVDANAGVDHVKLQDEHPEAFHVGTVAVVQDRDSRFRSHSLALGARLSRTDIRCALQAPGATCSLSGLTLLGGAQHADHHTHVDHIGAHTSSRELFKAILDDTARGVFTGRVVVRPDAQHIDAVQANHNLLLSDRAVANSRPQLEIRADDVKCAHGATIGQLDPDALFYLRQRCLDRREAQGLLTWAFANEVVQGLPDGPLRDEVGSRVRAFLAARTA